MSPTAVFILVQSVLLQLATEYTKQAELEKRLREMVIASQRQSASVAREV